MLELPLNGYNITISDSKRIVFVSITAFVVIWMSSVPQQDLHVNFPTRNLLNQTVCVTRIQANNNLKKEMAGFESDIINIGDISLSFPPRYRAIHKPLSMMSPHAQLCLQDERRQLVQAACSKHKLPHAGNSDKYRSKIDNLKIIVIK